MSAEPTYHPCPTPRKGSLVAHYADAQIVGPLSCKKWSCPTCGARNARILRRRIETVPFNRFITLTVKPNPAHTPAEAAAKIRADWVRCRKRLLREWGLPKVPFVAVLEWTKRGAPHLHILLTSPFISQRTLSRHWKESSGNPIVDVRRIRHTTEIAKYLTNYLTKQSYMPPRKRKWTASRGCLPPIPKPDRSEMDEPVHYEFTIVPVPAVIEGLIRCGYAVIATSPDSWLALPPIPTPEQPPP